MDLTLAQEYADGMVLPSLLIRRLYLAIPDKHVGPSGHCQFNHAGVLPAFGFVL